MVARHLIIILCLAAACAGAHTPKEPAGPSIVLSAEAWTFGTLERGETTAGAISIASGGPDTLRASLYSTCDCLSVVPERVAIPPGEKRAVDLLYMGDEIKDMVTKTVFIDSNDPRNPRIAFKVTGTVTPGRAPHLVAIPDPLALDPRDPEYPQADLRIQNRGEEALDVLEITCFGCINTWSQKVLAGGEEAFLEVIPLPDWSDKKWLEIESNDPVQPIKRIAIVELD
jgi:hypothetical protein